MSDGAPDPAVADAVLMTLAGIAYGAPDDIPTYLVEAEPLQARWKAVWLPNPPDTPVNFAFMAKDAQSGTRVIAIRGTYPDPLSSAYWDDARQDSPFGDMVDWPGATGAKIAGGTSEGFQNLLTLTDGNGRTLEQAVAALPVDAPLVVTGHSLGGTLTPVIALWLAETFPGRPIEATSYAGLTPGNGAFAALFGAGTALDGKVRRVYNTLDTVPYGWDKVFATHEFYEPAPKGGPVVEALLLATIARLDAGGYDYAAVGSPVPLQGQVRPPAVSCDLVAYVIELLHQHMPDTYLALLGAPPLPFSIIFGSLVAPRDTAAALTKVSPTSRVFYL